MQKAGANITSFTDSKFNDWTDYHKGLRHTLKDLPVTFYGALDDVWVGDKGQLIVVDYKATSSDHEISIDDPWKIAYKHQVELYQWLLRMNGYDVSDSAYFVYTNALKTPDVFGDELKFETKLIEYVGHTDWVEGAIRSAYECLCSESIPASGEWCQLCEYVGKVKGL
jgi:hypothetical protein